MSIHEHAIAFIQLQAGDKVYRVRTMDDAQQLEGPHEIIKIENNPGQKQRTVYLQDLKTSKIHRTGLQVCVPAKWVDKDALEMPSGARPARDPMPTEAEREAARKAATASADVEVQSESEAA